MSQKSPECLGVMCCFADKGQETSRLPFSRQIENGIFSRSSPDTDLPAVVFSQQDVGFEGVQPHWEENHFHLCLPESARTW